MKKIMAFLVLAGIGFSTAPAAACITTPEEEQALFKALDKNGDGRLTRAEYYSQAAPGAVPEATQQEVFAGFDTDKDSFLSFEEYGVSGESKRSNHMETNGPAGHE